MADTGQVSDDGGSPESEASGGGSHHSQAHSAPKEAPLRLPTLKGEDFMSDLGVRRHRQPAPPSEHQRLVPPHHMDIRRLGTSPARGTSTDSRSAAVLLERARRQHTVACETTQRRRQRLNFDQRRMEKAESAEREAAVALTRAEWAAGQSARAGDSVAVATSPRPGRECRKFTHGRNDWGVKPSSTAASHTWPLRLG